MSPSVPDEIAAAAALARRATASSARLRRDARTRLARRDPRGVCWQHPPGRSRRDGGSHRSGLRAGGYRRLVESFFGASRLGLPRRGTPDDGNFFGPMQLRDRLIELGDVIRAAAAASGARDVRVFGSVARGEDARDSDVDLLVRLEPGRTLLDIARLEVRLEDLLGRHVDVVTEAGLREPLRSAALREAISV